MRRFELHIPDEMWTKIERWRASQMPLPMKNASLITLIDKALSDSTESESCTERRLNQLESQVSLLMRVSIK